MARTKQTARRNSAVKKRRVAKPRRQRTDAEFGRSTAPHFNADESKRQIQELLSAHKAALRNLQAQQEAECISLKAHVEAERKEAVEITKENGGLCVACPSQAADNIVSAGSDILVCSLCASAVCAEHASSTRQCNACMARACANCLARVLRCSHCELGDAFVCCDLVVMKECSTVVCGDCVLRHMAKHCSKTCTVDRPILI